MSSNKDLTYAEALERGRQLLDGAGIAESGLDSWYIFSEVTGISRAGFLLRREEIMPGEEAEGFFCLIGRREKRIPLQYLLGSQEFMGLKFTVTPDVLIPRQDTEILVMRALEVCRGRRVLDICTGSGCIIVSLEALGNIAHGTGADISSEAVRLARINAEANNVQAEFAVSDMFENITGSYELIVSNPPYIPSSEIDMLMDEVREHEPRLALDGGADGLDFYRKLASSSGRHLAEGGWLMMEIGCGQADDVAGILEGAHYHDIEVVKDYAGLDRVVACRR